MRLFPALTIALVAAAPASAALAPGAKAPDFTTRGAIAGKVTTVSLSALLKRGPVVLYFFPAAFTPGCNAEAQAFAENVDAFRKAGATVVGMSADPVDALVKFSAKECAGKFAVASAGPAVVKGYDVALGQKVKGRDVTNRTSYVIARDGRITYAHSDLDAARHVMLTLDAVKRLRR